MGWPALPLHSYSSRVGGEAAAFFIGGILYCAFIEICTASQFASKVICTASQVRVDLSFARDYYSRTTQEFKSVIGQLNATGNHFDEVAFRTILAQVFWARDVLCSC